MRVLFVASGRRVPSTRFRILPYLPVLTEAGVRCEVAYSFPEKYDYFRVLGWRGSQLLKRTVRRWHAFQAKLKRYDAIFIEREVFDDDTWDIEQRLREATGRLILDLDDGVHLLHPEKFAKVVEMCDCVIAGNQELLRVVEPMAKHSQLIPTCVRMADYPQRRTKAKSDSVTIGWIGTTHNVAFLKVCAPALRKLARETTYRLLVVATTDERLAEIDLAGVNVEFRAWSPEAEIRDLHEMDIGLMPLPQGEEWMKFKCGLKLIQYLAVGIPGVATPIGVNADILVGEIAGRIALTEEDWYPALRELASDPELRLQLGSAGRNLVKSHYSVEANCERLIRILSGDYGSS